MEGIFLRYTWSRKRTIDGQKVKEISLDGLLAFTALCDKYGLRYYISFGSLIGAVRHQGYIPWDDDIDLLMPRGDYERLRGMSDEFKTDEWELLSYSVEPGFMLPFMKYCNRNTLILPSRFNTGFVYGISFDIFPLDFFDGSSAEEVKTNIVRMRDELIALERAAYITAVYKPGFTNRIKYFIKKTAFLMHPEKVKQVIEEYTRLDKLLTESSEKCGQFATHVYSRYGTVWNTSDFVGSGDQYSQVLFEGHLFTAPYRVDDVLRATYGDYMQLPPVEERVCGHSYIACYR